MDQEPSKPKRTKQKRKLIIIILSTLVVVLLLLFTKLFIKQRKAADRTGACCPMKQIPLALQEFHEAHNAYPSPSTVSMLNTKFPDHGHDLSGKSSNAMFRQFFVAGIVEWEHLCYANIPGTKKPDKNIAPGHLLEKGEVAISYNSNISAESDPITPILFCPLIPGTTKFDPRPFDGKAIISRLNHSVEIYDIEKDGHVYIDGVDILSPKHPVWKGKPPTIHYPEL